MHGLGNNLISNFLLKPPTPKAIQEASPTLQRHIQTGSSLGTQVGSTTGSAPSTPPFQVGADGVVIRDGSVGSALGWANQQMGESKWDNKCLAFVSMSMNIPRDPNRHPEVYSASNAITAYDNLKAAGKINESAPNAPIPEGAAVFFEATSKNGQHGHVAVATGRMAADGTPEVITSGWPGRSGVFTSSVGELSQQSGAYLGYANLATDGGQHIAPPTTPATPQTTDPTQATPLAPTATPPLGKGSTDREQIQQLQGDLVKMGYLTQDQMNTGPGIYGPRTESAVRSFQLANGLPVTGVYDQTTSTAMGQVLSGQPVTRPEPPQRPPHAPADGLPTSAEAANNHFLSQWGPTAYNDPPGTNDAPYGYNDCGPTSAVMALNALGISQQPSAENAHLAIDSMRDSMFGRNTTHSERMGFATIKKGLEANGAQGVDLPHSPVAKALEGLDQALEQGMPVMIGTNNVWSAWGADQRAQGNYINSRDPGGHFVTVLGKTPEGNYIVGDPLFRNGAVEVTPEQMTKALGPGVWGMVAVAPAS
jgi:peptidoglycan hydrolase-like protein with peptidoglycan-binding domain